MIFSYWVTFAGIKQTTCQQVVALKEHGDWLLNPKLLMIWTSSICIKIHWKVRSSGWSLNKSKVWAQSPAIYAIFWPRIAQKINEVSEGNSNLHIEMILKSMALKKCQSNESLLHKIFIIVLDCVYPSLFPIAATG